MKQLIQKLSLLLLTGILSLSKSHAQTNPEDGTYYIVNVATGDALTPVDANINANVLLKDLKKSGMQKWEIKKYTSKSKTGKVIVSYTIRNAATGYYLRPHHVPTNGNAIASDRSNYTSFSITEDDEHFIIKNNQMGGDAMYVKNGGALSDEPWFSADEESDKYRWKLVAAE